MPIDGEHIGFVTATWPPPEAKVPSLPVKEALLLPWEECEAIDDRERVYPRDTKRVVVVWLPAANFNFNPLRCLASLIDQLAPEDIRDKIDVRLIGPANSTGLQTMVKEACWDQVNTAQGCGLRSDEKGTRWSDDNFASGDRLGFNASL